MGDLPREPSPTPSLHCMSLVLNSTAPYCHSTAHAPAPCPQHESLLDAFRLHQELLELPGAFAKLATFIRHASDDLFTDAWGHQPGSSQARACWDGFHLPAPCFGLGEGSATARVHARGALPASEPARPPDCVPLSVHEAVLESK